MPRVSSVPVNSAANGRIDKFTPPSENEKKLFLKLMFVKFFGMQKFFQVPKASNFINYSKVLPFIKL